MIFERRRIAATDTVMDLSTANQLVLWSFRHWVRAFVDGIDATPDLRRAYGYAGAGPAVGPFELAMMMLTAGGRRRVSVHCPHCQEITEDERAFCTLIEAFQQGDADVAYAILGDWLWPAARRVVWQPLGDFAGHLARRGIWVQRGEAVQAPAPTATPDVRTLH